MPPKKSTKPAQKGKGNGKREKAEDSDGNNSENVPQANPSKAENPPWAPIQVDALIPNLKRKRKTRQAGPYAQSSTAVPACDYCQSIKRPCTKGQPCDRCKNEKRECIYSNIPNKTQVRSSCDECHRKKEKCSKERPTCARCAKRRVECVYQDATAPPKPPLWIPNDPSTTPLGKGPKKGEEEKDVVTEEDPLQLAFRLVTSEFSSTSRVAPLLSETGTPLPSDNQAVVEALKSREEYYLSLPAFQVQALALFRGYKSARDANDQALARTNTGFSRWLAEYDILFSEYERALWLLSHVEIASLPQIQTAPSGVRTLKLSCIRWLLDNTFLSPQFAGPVTSIPACSPEDLDNARIFWQNPLSYSQLVNLAQGSQKQTVEQTSQRVFSIEENYWFYTVEALRRLTSTRGIGDGSQSYVSHNDLVNFLQIYDARRGVEPTIEPTSYSRFHGMSHGTLYNLARLHKGAPQSATKQALIEFLMAKELKVEDRSEADTLEITRLLLADIEESLARTLDKQAMSAAVTAHTNYQSTWNNGLVAPASIMSQLQNAIEQGLQPAPTSNAGHLCGVRALAAALRPIRNRIYLREMPEEGIIEDITHHDMMEFLFLNYDPATADDLPNMEHGIPTPDYAELLEERIGSLRAQDNSLYERTYQEMTAMSNLALDQLSMVLELMFRAEWLSQRYAIGVVREGHTTIINGEPQTIPATAQVHGPVGEDSPMVWLYNDGWEQLDSDEERGIQRVSHWEGFELPHSETHGIRKIHTWGFSIPDAASIPTPRFGRISRGRETITERTRREKANAAAKRTTLATKLRKMCLRCQDNRSASCDVEIQYNAIKKACSSCTDSNQQCELPKHITPYAGPKMSNEVTKDDIKSWVTPFEWGRVEGWLSQAAPEVEPTGPYFAVHGSARLSSNGGLDEFQRILHSLPRTMHQYDILLSGPALQHVPEGQRPTMVMRQFATPFCRQGTRAIPIALGNRLTDPFLRAFVTFTRNITRPNNPNPPVELHHLLLGIAGFSVGINGWGDRTQGYFKVLLDADRVNQNRHFEDNTYIVVVVEPIVVDGVADCSLDYPNRSIGFHGHQNKYIAKYKLRSLIDRHHDRNSIARGVLSARPAYYEAHWDDDQRNDTFLDAMAQEYGWRSNAFDDTTSPTDALIHARNNHRNRA